MTELIDATSDLAGTRDAERAYELDRAHVFHSWSAQAEISPMVVTRAEGSHVWDGDGKRYLDFSSQLVFTNLGHQHPRIVAAFIDGPDLHAADIDLVRQQAGELLQPGGGRGGDGQGGQRLPDAQLRALAQ